MKKEAKGGEEDAKTVEDALHLIRKQMARIGELYEVSKNLKR